MEGGRGGRQGGKEGGREGWRDGGAEWREGNGGRKGEMGLGRGDGVRGAASTVWVFYI